jgi:hypothetical protein
VNQQSINSTPSSLKSYHEHYKSNHSRKYATNGVAKQTIVAYLRHATSITPLRASNQNVILRIKKIVPVIEIIATWYNKIATSYKKIVITSFVLLLDLMRYIE